MYSSDHSLGTGWSSTCGSLAYETAYRRQHILANLDLTSHFLPVAMLLTPAWIMSFVETVGNVSYAMQYVYSTHILDKVFVLARSTCTISSRSLLLFYAAGPVLFSYTVIRIYITVIYIKSLSYFTIKHSTCTCSG
jgi:hypothetical protein